MPIVADNSEYTETLTVTPNGQTLTFVFKPGSAGANQELILGKLVTALDQLELADANWTTLTAAQKDAAQRFAVWVAAKLSRLVLGRLDAS